MVKRLARCLLAMCLAIGLMPTLAFADEGAPESTDGYIYKDVAYQGLGAHGIFERGWHIIHRRSGCHA